MNLPSGSNDLDVLQASPNKAPKAKDTQPAVTLEIIEDIQPLDSQFGIEPKKAVPDTLQEALFGQAEPTKSEIAEAGGDLTKFPSMRTYAILDGAKVQGLPEMLEASELEHSCIFKGEALNELGDVAPWIVELEDDNQFVRNLFTTGNAPWELWDKNPGVFVRSRDILPDLLAHLRKFIKVRDEAEKWFYLRLYDPHVMRAFLHNAPVFSNRILSRPPPWSNLSIITCLGNQAEIVRPSTDTFADAQPIQLGAKEKAVLRHLTFEARADALMTTLDKSSTIAMSTDPNVRTAQKDAMVAAFHRMQGYGFQQPLQQKRWGVWELFYGRNFERADPTLARICDTRDTSSGERFVAFQRRLEELYS